MFTYNMNLTASSPETLTQKANAKIFPNPSSGNSQLVFTPLTNGIHSIDLFDANGKWVKKILAQNLAEKETLLALDGSDLPPGNYFIQIKTPSYQFSKKWILVN